jgi:hypothetical protein
MNTNEITIPVTSVRTPQRFSQWFTTVYEQLFKSSVEIKDIGDITKYRNGKMVEQIDRLICEQIPATKEIKEIWLKAGKKSIFVNSRKRELSDGRKLAAVLLREKKYTLVSIGMIMGKDHSTIIHSLESAENLMDTDASFRRMYNNVKFALNYEEVIRPSDQATVNP